MNLICYLILVLLINQINCDKKELCEKFEKYKSFQTHMIFNFYKNLGNKKSSPIKSYEIKETFHKNKEKLEIFNLNDETDKKIYIFDFNRQLMYEKDVYRKTCKSTKIGTTIPSLGLIPSFRDESSNFVGPSALFNIYALGEKYHSNETFRGIEADVCEFTKRDHIKLYVYRVYLAKKVYKLDYEPILGIQYRFKKVAEFDNTELNYIKFEKLNNNQDLEDEDKFWYLEDYCVEKDDNDRDKYPREHFSIPKQFEFKIKNQDNQLTKIIKDNQNKLLKLTNSIDEIILDLGNRIIYKLNSNGCIKKFNDDYESLIDNYEEFIELTDKLAKLELLNYVGVRECKPQLNCDTFNLYANDRSILYTFSFIYDTKTNQNNLIQIKKQLFEIHDDDMELVNTDTYEIYDFKNLEHNYRESIDFTDCSYEDEHKIEIRIGGSLDDSAINEIHELENETLDKIIELTGLTYYNIPKLYSTIDDHNLIVNLKLIQPINDLFYLNRLKDYSISFDRLNIKIARKSLEECALLAKQKEWLGIQYCSNQLDCYPINDEKLFYLDEKEEKNDCFVFKKIDTKPEIKYVTIPESINLIEQNIKQNKFKLTGGFNFQSFENFDEFNHIDKDNIFNLIKKDNCLNQMKIPNLDCKLKARLSDCIFHCQSTDCNMFSIEQINEEKLKCCFLNETFSGFKKKYELDDESIENGKTNDYLIKNEKCNLYELSYLIQFTKLTGKTIQSNPSKPLSKFVSDSPENCAINCLNSQFDSRCLSFSYCATENAYICELSKYNPYVLNDESFRLIDSHSCTLYSVNFLVDYHKIKFKYLENSTISTDYSLQECAKHCKSDENCSKFNYCKNNDNIICQLESNRTAENDQKLEGVCTSYLENSNLILDDLIDRSNNTRKSNKDTKRDFSIWYYLFFFSLGLKIGASLILAKRAIRKKKTKNGKYYVKFDQDSDLASIKSQITQPGNYILNSTRNKNLNQEEMNEEILNHEIIRRLQESRRE